MTEPWDADPLDVTAADHAPRANGRDTKGSTMRDDLLNLAQIHYAVGRSDDERVYLVPVDGPNVALFSGQAKTHLARRYFDSTRRSVGRTPLDEAWMTLEGLALDLIKSALPLRVAATDGGQLVLDLGDVAGHAVVVGTHGWSVVGRAPVTFRRSKAALPLPVPTRGGALAELFEVLPFTATDRDLAGAWVTSTLFAALPHPATVLGGEQGAAKTTTARTIGQLVDPCMAATQKPPRNEEEWSQSCSARWLVAVDNVSTVPDWWSDAMCRTVTGDGWLRRALYTDDEVIVTAWRRCLILNGATLGAKLRPDLAERLIAFHLDRPTQWLTESEVDDRLAGMRPRLLGVLLDAASATLAAASLIEPVRDLRMADFATFLAAYDAANGTTALDAYRAKIEDLFSEALTADPLAQAVVTFMEDLDSWAGTVTELLHHLEPYRPKRDDAPWPVTAHHLSGAMTACGAMLRQAAVAWHPPTGKRRIARLTWLEGRPGAPGTPQFLVLAFDGEGGQEEENTTRGRSE